MGRHSRTGRPRGPDHSPERGHCLHHGHERVGPTEEAKLEALEIFDQLDARPMADRVRSKLRDLGVERVPRGPTKATLSNPAGLTARQLEVLRLMADGLTNSQIADELYLSKKTVEHHVSAVYSKLGVSSRSRAIRAAVEVGAVEK